MVERNPNMSKLKAGYLFPEIARRKKELLAKEPASKIISLGIGDTTEPIPEHIARAMSEAALELGTPEGYSGYGQDQGDGELRKRISEVIYKGVISNKEIFVSDGAKCDIGRLQFFFGPHVKIAVQDPSYPAFVDSCVIAGQSALYNEETKRYDGIIYLPCTPENNFFPDLSDCTSADILYICSPNNPTGAVATYSQLEELVKVAQLHKMIILFDSAYSSYIQDSKTPKSIYEIPGADTVAIETGSFSKLAGFTGVRLGWTVVPKALKFSDESSVHETWRRLFNTVFNNASNIAQQGGIACLSEEGQQETTKLIKYYLKNADILAGALRSCHLEYYGSSNAPYVWVRFNGRSSWDVFDELLNDCHIVCSPGSGFGPAGEGFIRLSSFGHREDILEAARRLRHHFS